MNIGGYRFRPSRWPTLVVLLLLPMLLALGFWQLDRAEQKREWLAAVETGRRQPPLDLNVAQPAYEAAAHRRAVATGRYDAAHQVLLDNQVRDQRWGYLVLTPLRLDGTDLAVLVDRGWLAAPPDRTQLPELTVEGTPTTVRGDIDRGPSIGLRLGGAVSDASWPLRIQYLDYDALNRRLPYRILPYLIRLDPTEPQGYRRDWEPVPPMGPSTHIGYAVQWFGLATALLVIYIVVNTKRIRSAGRE